MATFGVETESIFDNTDETLNSIFVSANMLATHYWQRQGNIEMEQGEFERHLEEMRQHQGIFWDGFSKDDEVRSKLAEIQNELERRTKPCFEEPGKNFINGMTAHVKRATECARHLLVSEHPRIEMTSTRQETA